MRSWRFDALVADLRRAWREPPSGATLQSIATWAGIVWVAASLICGIAGLLIPDTTSSPTLIVVLAAVAGLFGLGVMRLARILPRWFHYVSALSGLVLWALWAEVAVGDHQASGAIAAPTLLIVGTAPFLFALRAALILTVIVEVGAVLMMAHLGVSDGDMALMVGTGLLLGLIALRLARLGDIVFRYFEHIGVEAFMKDLDGRYLLANATFRKAIGVSPDAEVLGRTDLDLVGAERAAEYAALDAEALAAGAPVQRNVTVVGPTGERVQRIIRFPIRSERGDTVAIGVLVADVTDTVRSEAALAASEAQWQYLAKQATDGVVILTPDGTIQSVNDKFCELLDLRRNDLVGRRISEFHHPDNVEPYEESVVRITTGASATLHKVYARRDGSPFYARVQSLGVADPDGEPVRIVSIYHDEGEERRQADAIVRAEKLDAVGQLAGGVAHDINNLLSGIVGYAELLRESDTDPTRREFASQVIGAALRASDYSARLLSLARTDDAVEPFDLNQVIGEVAQILRATVDQQVQVTDRLGAERACVAGNASQVHGALLNLGLNAVQSIEGAGRVEFRSELFQSDDGPHVRVHVIDSGVGIPPELLKRVFDPFFTTKSHDRGTGLGLTSVLASVSRYGGTVDVTSQVGEGSTFTLTLPLIDEPVGGSVEASAAAIVPGTEVLVVDDDPAVRYIVAEGLRRSGCSVIEAGDGATALAELEAAAELPSVMVFDLRMPGMDGIELFRAVHARWPSVQGILMSGFGGDADAGVLRAEGVQAVLQKPFASADLVEAVARVNGSPA